MRLAFIGISNIGKSFWARNMAARHGFVRINCDGMIEEKIQSELPQKGIGGVAQWMGLPHSPDYRTRSEIYLGHEANVAKLAIGDLNNAGDRPTVIDTTGSVIYLSADILKELRKAAYIVYFDASEAYADDLFKRYIAHPKPTIWGDQYKPLPDETPRQTLKRCYPNLLNFRAKRYSELAHTTIPFDIHRNHDADMLKIIKQYMAKA